MIAPHHSASRLAAVEVEPITRGALLLRGALATASVYGVAAVGPAVHRALAHVAHDIEFLGFALTLEYLEQDFYDRAVRELGLSAALKELAEQLRDDEQEHIANLVAGVEELGAKPVRKPRFEFPFEDQASFLELAEQFAETVVSGYNGAAPGIESADVLATAGTIVQVEGRHAAAVRLAKESDPTVGPFDEARFRLGVETTIARYIVFR